MKINKLLSSMGSALFAIVLILMLIVLSTGVAYVVLLTTSSVILAILVGQVTALFFILTAQDYLFN